MPQAPADATAYRDDNRVAWDRLVAAGSPLTAVATDEQCLHARALLDREGWLPQSIAGLEVLCLAAGGGRHSILYAAAGAHVTVVDLCPAVLELDRREAERRGYSVRIVEASMEDLSQLGDAIFDIVHQPVSTCYVPDVAAVYREVARVLRLGGLYIGQHKQPASLQASHRLGDGRFVVGIPYSHSGPLPDVAERFNREDNTVEFLHRWDQLIGELCTAGFVVEGLSEPNPAQDRNSYLPPFVRIKGRRVARAGER
ncbi:MAG TPA: class I SAM-dependent methyltransferase [Pirellulales bacterium]|nr:class I SAM-dependent methyltransferase [Pirellulales bacterium]